MAEPGTGPALAAKGGGGGKGRRGRRKGRAATASSRVSWGPRRALQPPISSPFTELTEGQATRPSWIMFYVTPPRPRVSPLSTITAHTP